MTQDQSRPLGILAGVLSLLVFVGAVLAFERYSFDRARAVVRPYADVRDPRKWLLLGLERAALADPRAMLLFGRSEFWYTGPIATPSQFFKNEPTGFWVFETGFGGTDSLFFLETVAALGSDLRGRKVAISLSSTSFYQTDDVRNQRYAGNFSPRIVNTVAFDSPISASERQYLARRALDHSDTLHDLGLARVALTDLADDTPLHRLSYALIYPLGQIQVRMAGLNEARQVLDYANASPVPPEPASFPTQTLDWQTLITTTTDTLVQAAGNDPFGASPDMYTTGAAGGDALLAARTRYNQGLSNRDGQLAPVPPGYLPAIENSVERTDLEHELAVLHELGATPFVINRPDDGFVLDYSVDDTSAQATRQQYLDFMVSELEQQGVPYVSFGSHDEDRFFIRPASDHFMPRGWLFANRALDLFWHGASNGQIAAAMVELDQWSPSPPPLSAPIATTVAQVPAK